MATTTAPRGLLLGIGLLALALAPAPAAGVELRAAANPVRKVVTMLQKAMAQVEAEGRAEKALFEKFMCYCKSSGGDLKGGIEAMKTKIPELETSVEAGQSKMSQLEKDLQAHKADRAAAEKAVADAEGVRASEKKAFEQFKAEAASDIEMCGKATVAIEKGMGAAFLQSASGAASTARAQLQRAVDASQALNEADREEMLSFLAEGQGQGQGGSTGYEPASGEIVGILKQMQDEMVAELKERTAQEEASVKGFGEATAAKEQELATLTKMVEEKLERLADLGVKVAEMKNDLEDTRDSLTEDEKFIQDLAKNCAKKTEEWKVIEKTRSEELLALSDTIKILNDDDALDLFKKTLPSAASAASLLQVQVTSGAMRARALATLEELRRRGGPRGGAAGLPRAGLDFVALALKGRKVGFGKVIEMIEELVATLQQEQRDDDKKKGFCEAEFDKADDKKKGLERQGADLETVIAETKENIVGSKEEIKELAAGIKDLDKAVAEATAQRKDENKDYKEVVASDTAAKEILLFAKNRLQKFYNPKLYKAPKKSLAQVSAAPPPPPETAGAYKKKGEETNGVLAMIDLLVQDLDKELTEAKAAEKDAQGDYERTMKDSQEKRTQDSKALSDREDAVAEMEAALVEHKANKKSAAKELAATLKYIQSLHGDCDFLLKYYAVRKEARTGEIDGLGKAKAVLSGADYSL